MMWLWKTLSSSIGKKILMALTGLALCGFLATHLLGNLFVYAGEETLDNYAKLLRESSLLLPAEIFLLSLFLVHVVTALRLTIGNMKSRPTKYIVQNTRGAQTVQSATMVFTGVSIVIFVVIHLINFRFAEAEIVDGKAKVFKMLGTAFQGSSTLTLLYVVAVFFVGVHLSHGFQSALRTLGLRHPRFDRFVLWAGYAFAGVMTVGFASIPLYFYFVLGEIQ